jgi:hypothetical protein
MKKAMHKIMNDIPGGEAFSIGPLATFGTKFTADYTTAVLACFYFMPGDIRRIFHL